MISICFTNEILITRVYYFEVLLINAKGSQYDLPVYFIISVLNKHTVLLFNMN